MFCLSQLTPILVSLIKNRCTGKTTLSEGKKTLNLEKQVSLMDTDTELQTGS